MVLSALFAFRPGSVVLTVETSSMAEGFVVDALVCETVAFALFTFSCVLRCSSSPGLVVVQWFTHVTVRSSRVVLALTLVDSVAVWETLGGVEVAFASTHDEDFRNSVVVRPQGFGIAEDFVTEGIESDKSESKFLDSRKVLELSIVLEIGRARSPLENRKENFSVLNRRSRGEFGTANGHLWHFCADIIVRNLIKSSKTRGAVVLHGRPFAVLELFDDHGFWAEGGEVEDHRRYFIILERNVRIGRRRKICIRKEKRVFV